MFPVLLDTKADEFAPEGIFSLPFRFYLFASICVTTYRFGRAAWKIFSRPLKN